MHIGYEQIVVDGSVKTKDELDAALIAGATHAELQAETQPVRYTMDDSTEPAAATGMLLLVAHEPKSFLIEDIARIKFTQSAGGAAVLNIHYFGGREI